jgi:outer membrane protein assembly factor BamB
MLTIVGIALLIDQAALGRGENWPGFRGPTGLGLTQERNLPLKWGGPDGENVLWKAPLRGEGHASPIVWEDRVFVSTALWPPSVQDRTKVIPEHHLFCYRASDGELLWDTLVPPGPWLRTDFRSGPGGGYACPTPTTDGTLVYCAFGSAVIAAVDFQGKIVWRKEIVPYTFDVTLGSSPVLYHDTVILLCAMAKSSDSGVIAYDKTSGEVKWQQKLAGTGFGHSTPVIIQAGAKPQMLVLASGMEVSGSALQSLDPSNGRRLWWCRGAGDAASPACGSGLVYFDSGRRSLGVAVDPTGSGDVSKSHVKWTVAQVPEAIGSPIIVGDYVYRLHVPGVLKCWEAATGKQVYAARLEGISTTWASPIADPLGNIYFANAGKSFVIQAGPQFKVLATNDLADGNHASPAVSAGSMFLVGMKHVYCVKQRAGPADRRTGNHSKGMGGSYMGSAGMPDRGTGSSRIETPG